MTKRQRCQRCQKPISVCICHAITPLSSRHQVWILRHPSEIKSAKGTAQLCSLVLNNCQLFDGETETDFTELKQRIVASSRPTWLLYPDDNATSVESLGKQTAAINLLVLDGTWKKAYRILQMNPWLQQLPKLSFDAAPEGQYQIRKASRSDSLSTLEAIGHCLNHLDECDTQPLFTAFDALKQSQLAHMPENIRKRY